MDVIGDPRVEKVVIMTSSQVGKTEVVNNASGYFVHLRPGPMLVVQPTVEMARAWVTDRLEPMTRDSPVLSERIAVGRTKAGRATKQQKTFPGGHLTCVGANSPAGLASRPISKLFFDEVDRFPLSAGKEGDPVQLAERRTTTFHDRKILMVSTPTTAGISRIDKAFQESDRRFFHVPCPHCGAFQPLVWEMPETEDGRRPLGGMVWSGDDPHDSPATARYQCRHCHRLIDHEAKTSMLKLGEWIPTNPSSTIAGFYVNALYSPWASWSEVVSIYLKSRDDPAQLQVFINTMLGVPWEDGDRVDADQLEKLAEAYDRPPAEVLYLSAGVDVQADRLEALLCGWGPGDECWALEHKVIMGKPEDVGDPCWAELERWRLEVRERSDGQRLHVQIMMVDSGYLADSVYAYCRRRYSQRVFATKGIGGIEKPVVVRRQRRVKGQPTKCPVFTVGADAGKDMVFARLKKRTPGPGRIHFPDRFESEFFAQVTSEVRRVEFEGGRSRVRYVKIRARNEALDLLVLNLAGLHLDRPTLLGPVEAPPAPQQELPLPKTESEAEQAEGILPGQRLRSPKRRKWMK